ncbi:hypothetical protein [Janibacter hoylei]|nr:hypothetical protein [Janibacter hoylei]
MRTTPSRTIQATACAIALIGLTACGGSDSEGSSTTSTSSSSADLTYDDDYAVDAARATESKRRAHDPNTKLSDDTPWATEDYIDTFNRNVTAMKEAGVVEKGTVKVNSVHLATSDPDAPRRLEPDAVPVQHFHGPLLQGRQGRHHRSEQRQQASAQGPSGERAPGQLPHT